MAEILNIFVHGTPQPQGSAKAFHRPGMKHAVITSDNTKLKPWRQDVSLIAARSMNGRPMVEGAVRVSIAFQFVKPISTPKRVTQKVTKPDIDKLSRGVLDALTGIAFRDDSQVVMLFARKEFSDTQGAQIQVEAI